MIQSDVNRNQGIDTLRGMAVLAVLIYHFFPEVLKGGWLGVDVFFVLSGYLMAQLLSKDITTTEFIVRRVTRLISPVFFLIGLLSLVTLFLIVIGFSPNFNVFEIFFASTFLSNVYYFLTVDYFSQVSSPLIHFWSLGLEFQYYALIAFLAIFSRSVGLYVWLIIVGLVFEYLVRFPLSYLYLGASEQSNINETMVSSALFYLLPARLWEFGFGGAVFFISLRIKEPIRLNWFLFCALMVLQFLVAESYSLIDRLIIVMMTSTLLLCRPPRVWAVPLWKLGLFSYSVYLVHMPLVFVINEYYEAYAIYMLILSILLGYLLFLVGEVWLVKVVHSYRIPFIIFTVCLLSILSFGVLFVERLNLGHNDDLVGRQEFFDESKSFVKAQMESYNAPYIDSGVHGTRRVALVGDSTSSDILGGMDLLSDQFPLVGYRRFGLSHKCHFGEYERTKELRFTGNIKLAESCDSSYESMLAEITKYKPDIILISVNWYSKVRVREIGFVEVPIEDPVRLSVKRLEALLGDSVSIYLIGKRPAFLSVQQNPYDDFIQSGLDKASYEQHVFNLVADLSDSEDKALKAAVYDTNARFIDYRRDIFCDEETSSCRVFTGSNVTLRDSVHWSREGAKIFTLDLLGFVLK